MTLSLGRKELLHSPTRCGLMPRRRMSIRRGGAGSVEVGLMSDAAISKSAGGLVAPGSAGPAASLLGGRSTALLDGDREGAWLGPRSGDRVARSDLGDVIFELSVIASLEKTESLLCTF